MLVYGNLPHLKETLIIKIGSVFRLKRLFIVKRIFIQTFSYKISYDGGGFLVVGVMALVLISKELNEI